MMMVRGAMVFFDSAVSTTSPTDGDRLRNKGVCSVVMISACFLSIELESKMSSESMRDVLPDIL